jgi:RNA polymerase sigma-70 factor (ECF subfamily)
MNSGEYMMIDLMKASQGDKEAFDRIVGLYNEKVKKIASIYTGSNADDITQDVWIKIYDKRQLLAHVENFDNWLFLVVRNTCFNYLKIEKKKSSELPLHGHIDFIDVQTNSPDVLDIVIKEESIGILRSVIKNMPEAYSLPLIMRYSKGMSLAEISETLNLPLSTVKWRLHAGKIQIKKAYRKGGYDE